MSKKTWYRQQCFVFPFDSLSLLQYHNSDVDGNSGSLDGVEGPGVMMTVAPPGSAGGPGGDLPYCPMTETPPPGYITDENEPIRYVFPLKLALK